MTPLERFKKFLSSQNLRMTDERLLVLDEVLAGSGHFTVSDLIARVQAKSESMGRSTVYRLIPLMLQAGLIFEVSIREGRGEQVYEKSDTPRHHDHLSCEICGAVIEFEEDAIHDLEAKIAKRHGYRLCRHVHHLRGICSSCQENLITEAVGARGGSFKTL
jgi:Fur family transcriptional regulator, ferric uptake regulator